MILDIECFAVIKHPKVDLFFQYVLISPFTILRYSLLAFILCGTINGMTKTPQSLILLSRYPVGTPTPSALNYFARGIRGSILTMSKKFLRHRFYLHNNQVLWNTLPNRMISGYFSHIVIMLQSKPYWFDLAHNVFFCVPCDTLTIFGAFTLTHCTIMDNKAKLIDTVTRSSIYDHFLVTLLYRQWLCQWCIHLDATVIGL